MQTEPTRSVASRRTKVKDRRGIYYRVGAGGRRRYEITYRDSHGRQRWQVVDGGLREAEAALEDVRRKLRRGERVAPSQATFAEIARVWLASQTGLRPRTRESYETQLRVHLEPAFGTRKIAQLTEDDVAAFIAEMQAAGYKGWSIRAALTPLGRVLGYAARRGLIGQNPMERLQRGERPSVGRRDMRILTRDEIGKVLDGAGDAYRPLLATAVFTGLRLGELLGLTWRDVDFDGAALRVRRQLDRRGERVEPKTDQAVREVVLIPALGRTLREHKLRSPFARDEDFMFASSGGGGLDHTIPRAALRRALKAAELDGGDRPSLRFHDLRHTFASLAIAQGLDVVFVSRQLGHASPDVTLKVYSHLFDAAQHAERASAALEASFGHLLDGNALETGGGDQRRNDGAADGGQVAFLRGAAAAGD